MALTRREFLRWLSAGAAVAATAPLLGRSADGDTPALPGAPADAPPVGPRSRLHCVYNPIVVKGGTVAEKYLARMLDAGLTGFCDVRTERDAWRRLIGPADKVLIKFNRSGADAIATSEPMLKALLASLSAGGVGPDRVMLLDASPAMVRDSGTVRPILGFADAPTMVLGRPEHYSAALDWADCLINIPFIKDHHLAGVTCGMKNLSHGLIKTPARWHGNRCREAIPHLFSQSAIRDKLKLTICNGLRIVVDGGPAARQESIDEYSRLIFATDLVALDALAARAVDQARGARGLRDLAEQRRSPDYLMVARDLKLGQPELDRVDLVEVEA